MMEQKQVFVSSSPPSSPSPSRGEGIRRDFPLAGVPAGTTGTVVRIDAARSGYDLMIEWNVGKAKPAVHWLTKREYEQYLVEAS